MPKIAVNQLEYAEGGRVIWIHNSRGVTVLRIHCTGKIKTHRATVVDSSIDLNVVGDITVLSPHRTKSK